MFDYNKTERVRILMAKLRDEGCLTEFLRKGRTHFTLEGDSIIISKNTGLWVNGKNVSDAKGIDLVGEVLEERYRKFETLKAKKGGLKMAKQRTKAEEKTTTLNRKRGNGDPIAIWIAENVDDVDALRSVVIAANIAVSNKQTDGRFNKTVDQINATKKRPNPGLARMSLGLILRRLFKLSAEDDFAKWIKYAEKNAVKQVKTKPKKTNKKSK